MTELNHKCANLIIAGFGKAGTTSLFEYLSSHPDICGSAVKETKFFYASEISQTASIAE